MSIKLKLAVTENKNNKQFNLSLPKRKIPKKTLMDIRKNKYIKVRLLK